MSGTEVKEAVELKPTPIKPGVWRNRYETINAMRLFDPVTAIITERSPGEVYFGYGEWDSEEAARDIAAGCELNPESDTGSGDARYLGPVFVPENPSP